MADSAPSSISKAAGYKDPVLIAATDGVGTKLKVAISAGIHDTVGIDLVAMSVNDLVVQGAEPLFFLDYMAVSRLDVETGRAIVAGNRRRLPPGRLCADRRRNGGNAGHVRNQDDYDLAGFAVGAVEREGLLTGDDGGGRRRDPRPRLDGACIPTAISLVRKIVETGGLDYAAAGALRYRSAPSAEALLAPTRIYVKSCLAAIRRRRRQGPRPHHRRRPDREHPARAAAQPVAARIDATRWTLPPVFAWLAETGGVARGEMARTFNCGIGMVAMVSAARADELAQIFIEHGETVTVIGDVIETPGEEPHVVLENVETAWQERNSRS